MAASSPSSSPRGGSDPRTPSPLAGAESASKGVALTLIGLFLAAILAQGAVLRNAWVLDDDAVVRTNPAVSGGLGNIRQAFEPEQWQGALSRGAWRPLTLTSFALTRPLWETADGDVDPLGPHLLNVFLHAMCVLLLWRALRLLLPDRPGLALWSALLFAVHPLHTGTVSMLTGRAEILAFAFGVAAVGLWTRALGWTGAGAGDRADSSPERMLLGRAVFALIFMLCALLSHEAAIAWLPVMLLIAFWRGRSVVAMALPLLPAALFFVLWPGVATGPEGIEAASGAAAPVLGLAAAGRTLAQIVSPVVLVGDHTDLADPGRGFDYGNTDLIFGALMLGLILLGWFLRRPGARPVFACAMLMAALGGMLASLVSAPGASLEMRFVYTALPALFVGVGLAFEFLTRGWFGARVTTPSVPGLIACGIATLGLVAVAHGEAAHWRNDEAFHDHLLAQRPGHVRALLRQARRARMAAVTQREAMQGMPSQLRGGAANPAYTEAKATLRSHVAEARDWITRVHATPKGRALSEAWREWAAIQYEASRWPEAARALERVWELDSDLRGLSDPDAELPTDPRRRRDAAKLYHLSGQIRGALGERGTKAAHLKVAARLAPGSARYQRDAGIALVGTREWPEALKHLERAVRAASSREEREAMRELLESSRERAREMAGTWFRQAQRHYEDGNQSAAVDLFEAAASADPLLTDAWLTAARLRGDWFGNYVRARRHLEAAEEALRSAPGANAKGLEKVRKMNAWLEKRRQEDTAEAERDG